MVEGYYFIPILIVGASDSGSAFIRAVRDPVPISSQNQKDDASRIVDSGILLLGSMIIPHDPYPIAIYLIDSGDIRKSPSPDSAFSEDARLYAGYIITDPYPNWGKHNERETRSLVYMVRESGLPFVITVKSDEPGVLTPAQIRDELQLSDDIKIIPCNAKTDPDSARRVLLELLALLPQDEVIHHAQNAIRAVMSK